MKRNVDLKLPPSSNHAIGQVVPVVVHNKVSVECVFLGRGNTIEAKNNGEDKIGAQL